MAVKLEPEERESKSATRRTFQIGLLTGHKYSDLIMYKVSDGDAIGFSMQAHVFFRDTWHHPYITSCFCGKGFYSPLCVRSVTAMQILGGTSPAT